MWYILCNIYYSPYTICYTLCTIYFILYILYYIHYFHYISYIYIIHILYIYDIYYIYIYIYVYYILLYIRCILPIAYTEIHWRPRVNLRGSVLSVFLVYGLGSLIELSMWCSSNLSQAPTTDLDSVSPSSLFKPND